MIPKLMDSSKTLYDLIDDQTEGLGRLAETTTAEVTEERNGAYYLEMKLPITAKHYKDITLGGIIKAKPNTTDPDQMFRISKISKPMNGIVTIRANHISYDLSKTSVSPISAVTNIASALSALKSHMAGGGAFVFKTDKTTNATWKNEIPQSARALLGGQQGSLLDVYGGEYWFNNEIVFLYANRGQDRGVRIAYGKNLSDIKQEENIESMYTAVQPYVRFSNSPAVLGTLQTLITSDEPKILNLDLTDRFDQNAGTPTVAQINAAAQSYINSNDLTSPSISIDVSFVNLADTEEYKNIAPLEQVCLCDTVSIYFDRLNITAQAKVITTKFNVLAERYNSIGLGNARSSFATTISNAINSSANSIRATRSFLEEALAHSTDLITGGLGGHVVITKNPSGEPEEILIMDTDDTATARNVIRMNMGGIGFSQNGYNGPFASAWDIDGNFNADFIRSGTIQAINIIGSVIQGSRIIFGDERQVAAYGLSSGIMFNGEGDIYFNTSGRFQVWNDTEDGVAMNEMTLSHSSNTAGEYNRAELFNFDKKGSYANSIMMTSQADSSGNHLDNSMNFRNYGEGNNLANRLALTSDPPTDTNAINFYNYNESENQLANWMRMSSVGSVSSFLIQNRQSGIIANNLEFSGDGTTNSLMLTNYGTGGTTANRIWLVDTQSSNQLVLANYDKDGALRNRFWQYATSGEYAKTTIEHMDSTGETMAAQIDMNTSSSGTEISLIAGGAYLKIRDTDWNWVAKLPGDSEEWSLSWIRFYDHDNVMHKCLGSY